MVVRISNTINICCACLYILYYAYKNIFCIGLHKNILYEVTNILYEVTNIYIYIY